MNPDINLDHMQVYRMLRESALGNDMYSLDEIKKPSALDTLMEIASAMAVPTEMLGAVGPTGDVGCKGIDKSQPISQASIGDWL